MTKTYEFVVLLPSELSENDVQMAHDGFVSLIKKHKGKVVTSDQWGKKTLAYKINKQNEAYYLFFVMEMAGEHVQQFDRDVRLNPQVMRYLIIIQEERHTKNKGVQSEE